MHNDIWYADGLSHGLSFIFFSSIGIVVQGDHSLCHRRLAAKIATNIASLEPKVPRQMAFDSGLKRGAWKSLAMILMQRVSISFEAGYA